MIVALRTRHIQTLEEAREKDQGGKSASDTYKPSVSFSRECLDHVSQVLIALES